MSAKKNKRKTNEIVLESTSIDGQCEIRQFVKRSLNFVSVSRKVWCCEFASNVHMHGLTLESGSSAGQWMRQELHSTKNWLASDRLAFDRSTWSRQGIHLRNLIQQLWVEQLPHTNISQLNPQSANFACIFQRDFTQHFDVLLQPRRFTPENQQHFLVKQNQFN